MMQQGMRRLGVVVGLLAAVAAWVPGGAQAVPVTYEFSGTVTSITSPSSFGAAAIGDVFSGSFTYETSTELSSFTGSVYRYNNAVNDLSFSVGSLSGYNGLLPIFVNETNTINIVDGFSDQFTISRTVADSGNGFTPAFFLFNLTDNSGSMFPSGALPTDLIIPDTAVARLLLVDSSTGALDRDLSANITSLTRASSVPEPSSLLLFSIGMLSLVIWRQLAQRANLPA